MKTMFAEWSCGCIGLYPREESEDKIYLIIRACDAINGEFDWFARRMENETYKALPPEESKSMNRELTELLADGYSFRIIQRLLNKS